MKLQVLQQNVPVKESITEIAGMITHIHVLRDGATFYTFQPKGLNADTGKPLKKRLLVAGNFPDAPKQEIDIPLEHMGKMATDTASGFRGKISEFIIHPNGCFHTSLQPVGINPKTSEVYDDVDFDFRQIVIDGVPPMSTEEKRQSIERKPSPCDAADNKIR